MPPQSWLWAPTTWRRSLAFVVLSQQPTKKESVRTCSVSQKPIKGALWRQQLCLQCHSNHPSLKPHPATIQLATFSTRRTRPDPKRCRQQVEPACVVCAPAGRWFISGRSGETPALKGSARPVVPRLMGRNQIVTLQPWWETQFPIQNYISRFLMVVSTKFFLFFIGLFLKRVCKKWGCVAFLGSQPKQAQYKSERRIYFTFYLCLEDNF